MTNADNLPTPREALVQGYQRLQLGEIEAADTWIYLARELREGARRVDPSGRPLALHDVEAIVCVHGRCAVRRKGGPGSWFLHSDDGSNCDGPDNQAETDWQRRITANEVDPLPHGTTYGGEPAYGAQVAVPMKRQTDGDTRDWHEDEPAYGVASPATTVSDLRQSETSRLLDVSRLRPQLADGLAETVTMQAAAWQIGDETACAHCPYPIFVYAEPLERPVGNEQFGLREWLHRATGQRVCPVPPGSEESYHPGAAHTFAEPRTRGTVKG